MFKRSIYTFIETAKNHKKIKSIKKNQCIQNVTLLTSEYLNENGIKYLALDFDGVLASHGKPTINSEVKVWLDTFVLEFDESKIFILSNKPTNDRLEYFKSNYPRIKFISNVAKKPYPDGLLKIRETVNCEAKEIALVDDRLLTGCLACIIAKCYPILITAPYIDHDNYTKSEMFFTILRNVEQKLFL